MPLNINFNFEKKEEVKKNENDKGNVTSSISSSSSKESLSIFDKKNSIFDDEEEKEVQKKGKTSKYDFANMTQKEILSSLYEIADNNTKQDDAKIHGMSDEEYNELRAQLEEYGIHYETLKYDNFDNVAKTMAAQIGKEWCYDKMAASYDSILDLVVDEKLNNALKEIRGGKEGDFDWDTIVNAYGDRLEKEYGIILNKISGGMYEVALTDGNGNIIEDENGNSSLHRLTDCMLPDGLAQDCERFASAALDAMGYDCISITDLSAEEYALVKQLASLDIKNTELGSASDIVAHFRGGSALSSTNPNINIKSTDYWNSVKGQYMRNSSASGANAQGGADYTSGANVVANAADKAFRIEISQYEFEQKVKEEMKNDSSLTKIQAERIVSKRYYTQGNTPVAA